MRISKEKALEIANKITEPLRVKYKEAENKIDEYVAQIALSRVPEPVMKLFKTHCEYINSSAGEYVSGEGIGRSQYVSFGKQIPTITNSGRLELSGNEAKRYVKLRDAATDAKTYYEKTKEEITNTIVSLGTPARIAEHLPEVKPFLPTKTTTAIMIPPVTIRKNISKLIKEAERQPA